MDDLVVQLSQAAPGVFDGEPVAFAFLYGSQATGTATARSDIDVAVHLEPAAAVDMLALRLRLARLLEDAIGVGPVEVVVLDEAPLTLAGRVREQGRLIHCRDPRLRVRWDSLVARQYHDFRIHERRRTREHLAHLAEGR